MKLPFSLLSLLFSAITPFAQLSAPLLPVTPIEELGSVKETLPNKSLWIEKQDERTLYSSSYTVPGGQQIVHHSARPINYFNESGKLVPIDASLYPSANGWSATNQPNPVYLNFDGSTELSISKNEKLSFNKNCLVNGIQSSGTIKATGNKILIEDFVPGIDKEYNFRENGVKYNYILKQSVVFNSSYFNVSEELIFSDGYKLIRGENGNETTEGWAGDLYLVNSSGEIVSRFMAPLCYDANKNFTIASYVVKQVNGKHILEIILPSSWLNDNSRAYPVVIDPLVLGPLTTWTGGQMPSCMSPVYNKDSILVTIPAAISITGLFVTSSYYADPFTLATMSIGSLKFSTICGLSQNFTVPNPQGNTPGTAYLDSFNILSPLMCCFMSNCSVRTFYLRMELARTALGVGCNTTYIRYDPTTTLWPFQAFVMGRTAEAYGQQWFVPNTPICGNQCTITGTVYCRYGVPPYTVTHPWSTPATIGVLNGCGTGAVTHVFTLTIPSCPDYCDTTSSLIVPPPTITDACGNTVSGIPSRTVPLKIAPDINATPDSLTVCSGNNFSVALSSCVSTAAINWYGNSITGTNNISDAPVNTTTNATVINYNAYATYNGCTSDTLVIPVTVDPLPIADFTYTQPALANVPVSFTDISTVYAGTETAWAWDFGDNGTSSLPNTTHAFANPGNYTVCFTITTSNGCIDSICREITVIAPDVLTPNVITPNGDGMNDFLSFKYLEFFPDNTLEVYNRWGNLIYSKTGYANEWNAPKQSSGTYYYILNVQGLSKTYTGFFEILH